MWKIEFTGTLGDKWFGGALYADRDQARQVARYLNMREIKISEINRGSYESARVVPA